MLLTIDQIFFWAKTTNSSRNFLEGNRILYANHIEDIGVKIDSNDEVHLFAQCLQTSHSKESFHEIEGKLNKKSGEIISMTCSCKAGLGEKCKHIIAVLLYCSR